MIFKFDIKMNILDYYYLRLSLLSLFWIKNTNDIKFNE